MLAEQEEPPLQIRGSELMLLPTEATWSVWTILWTRHT